MRAGLKHTGVKVLSILLLVLICLVPTGSSSKDNNTSENDLKALFILNFIKYVSWPSDVDKDHIVIGVTEESGMYNSLINVLERRTDNTRVRVERIYPASTTKYNVVFISQEESGRVDKWLNKFSGKGVLTISDECVSCGAAINLIKVNSKIRFEINLSGALQGGVKISNRLVELSNMVQ